MNKDILQKPPRKYDMFFNTVLTTDQEKIYQQWVNSLPINLRGDYDYDLRGAWLNGDKPDQYHHMPDTWKKPWHPTFSNESVYSTPGAEGGRWDGEEFHPSKLNKAFQDFKFGEWGKNTFAQGGPKDPPKKQIVIKPVNFFEEMKSPEEVAGATMSTADNTKMQSNVPPKVEPKPQIVVPEQPIITAAQEPQAYQSYYTNPIKEGWDNEAANFGYALGAGHPMSLKEMNNWTLNTMNLAGITVAPTLMGALESGYYFTTKRPVEGALTALLTPVKPTVNTIKNIRTNLAFNRSELPQQIVNDVKNAVNDDAQRWAYRTSQNGWWTPKKEYVEAIQSKPINYRTGFRNWFRYSDHPFKELLTYDAFNKAGTEIVMNPLSLRYNPQTYKGIVAHEARHSFHYPGMPVVSVPTEKYYGPNSGFELYDLIKPFKPASLKGKWHGSPEELLAEMASWKYQNNVLNTPYYQLSSDMKNKLIKDAASEFNINKLQMSNILDGLSKFGYFKDGGSIHIKPENRGKFTAAAKRVGKSVQEYASQILANKENYSPTLVKRANFARNAKKFH